MAGDAAGVVTVFRLEAGQQREVFRAKTAVSIVMLDWSRDGKSLAICLGGDRETPEIRMIQLSDSSELLPPLRLVGKGSRSEQGVMFASDGTSFYASWGDLTEWDPADTAKPRRTIPGAGRPVAWSRDRKRLACSNGVWDVAKAEFTRYPPAMKVARSASWSADDSIVFGFNGAAWKVGTQEVRPGHAAPIYASTPLVAANSPDGSADIVAGWPNYSIVSYGFENGKKVFEIHNTGTVTTSFSPDGKLLATAHAADMTLRVWDLAALRVRAVTAARPLSGLNYHGIQTSFWLPDRKSLYHDQILDVETLQPPAQHPLSGLKHAVHFMAGSPDGKYVAYSPLSDGNLRVLEAASGKEVRSGPPTRYGVWSPDSRSVLAGSNPATALDIEKGTSREFQGYSSSAAYSPDGQFLAICGGQFCTLFDAGTAAQKWRYEDLPIGNMTEIKFSPDGSRFSLLIDRGSARTLEVRETTSNKLVRAQTLSPNGLSVGILVSATRLGLTMEKPLPLPKRPERSSFSTQTPAA